jgi:hypothetical protein
MQAKSNYPQILSQGQASRKKNDVLSPDQRIKEPPIISQGGFPQDSGSSPSFCCKFLGSKGTVKLLQFDFKDLAKEAEEVESNKETIWLLKKFKKILLQSGKEFREFRDQNAG